MQKGKIEYFSVLRGIAILAVIITHIHQIFDLPDYMRVIPKFGQMGCQVFFLISGFFAFNPLYIYRERGSKNAIIEYYKKRFKRIAPGYWLTIVLGFIVCLLTIKITGDNVTKISTKPLDICVNILLCNGLVPTSANNSVVRGGWFVGTLVILYFLTPFLIWLFDKVHSKKQLPVIVFAICAFSLISISYIDSRLACKNNSFFYFSFVNQISCFLLGFVLKSLYLNNDLKTVNNPISKGLVWAVVSFCLFNIGYWKYNNIVYAIVPFTTAAAVFYFSCYFLTKETHSDSKLKNIVIKYGELDYAIMLIHPFIVFDFGRLILHYVDVPQSILYLVIIPVWYVVIYYVSSVYSKITAKVTAVIFK